jgi:hypothetical protein
MITLTDGTTTLTLNHVLWTNRAQASGVSGSEQVTLGGRLVVTRGPGPAGRQIILAAQLEGKNMRGWFTWAQVEQFMIWRDSGTTLVLNYNGEIRAAMIPLSGIDITPVIQASTAPAAGTICAGTLSMIEV